MPRSDQHTTPRRHFLSRLAAGAAAVASGLALPGVLSAAAPGMARDATRPQEGDWMRALRAKHRTVFDVAAHRNGRPLAQAKNYMDAWRDAFHVPDRDVNLVIGVHGEGFPLVLTDALWARYRIGEQYEVTDAATKAPAVVNVFTTAHVVANGPVTAEQTVDALQRRGVRFLVCMNTIAGATKKLAAAGMGAPEEIHEAIMAGLLPGVITVPAMVVALTQLQEHGLKYTKIA